MASKPGRNEPCPCGSGKKYKRCCLSKDEAAARAKAHEEMQLSDVEILDESELDDELDEMYEWEDTPFDVRDLTRVCYTRGFVQKLSEFRSGRGVVVTEWESPHVPQAILDSLERERVDALQGQWGAPKVADPIQVEVIDVETGTDAFTVEVFNRAIALPWADDEEVGRLHRVCATLEAVASGGLEPSADNSAPRPEVDIIIPPEGRTAPETTEDDLSGVLKVHRNQPGACQLCGEIVTRRTARRHAEQCAPAHDAPERPEKRLVQLRAISPELRAYWLDIEAAAEAKLEALDALLRRVWLECCGHLSVFQIGNVTYFSRGHELNQWPTVGYLGRPRPLERSMNARIGDALPSEGQPFTYEYDFGSTTLLRLEVKGERSGRAGKSPVRLLVRNTPPVWPCFVCGDPATLVCAYCLNEEGNPFVCDRHARQHACDERGAFLPVVNSPRMGVCGYAGES